MDISRIQVICRNLFASQGHLGYNENLNGNADMNRDIGKVIKQQRKNLSLTLRQLSEMSGVSKSHLGRIEQGLRKPSTHTLLKIAKPLGFDQIELLVVAGYLPSDPSTLPNEERDKLQAELNTLLDRVVADSRRIKEITDRLLMTS